MKRILPIIFPFYIVIEIASGEGESFPTACDCFENWGEGDSTYQEAYERTYPIRVKSLSFDEFKQKCIDKFASEQALKVRGTEEFVREMYLSFKDKCGG